MSIDSPKQPIFRIPISLVIVFGVLAVIHLIRTSLPEMVDADVLARLAFVPGRLTLAWDPAWVLGGVAGLDPDSAAGQTRIEVARFFLGDGSLQPWTLLTYSLLHGNWTHLGLNGIWLLAFGTPVARRFGSWRFVLFLLGGALAGAIAHYLVFPRDLQPLIGASAAVSGCMAAALRFMFQPDRQLGVGDLGRDSMALARRPMVPLGRMVRDQRAMTFLVVWFVTNLASGLGAVAMGISDAPIAWQAHIGGFLFGLLAFPFFDPVRTTMTIGDVTSATDAGRAVDSDAEDQQRP
ncbi:rhomboid family intramembrane serine protease [Lichenihabitans psoromatis]|uniref:rhomboid family intramembrane serine protease n=1 Tax=Lichenihabitans psoromatis TaxID=2528642 RepID=UPI0010384552|nr:rhomboid family intramembrane serine protease [Lichenihabitans psoromatis]